MKFFLDTANVDEIAELAPTGLVDGITTNPSLIAASGRNMIEVIKEITGLVDGPVSAEVTATDYETMVAEGQRLQSIAKNVTVKVPLTFDGLKACKKLAAEGTSDHVTLCFSATQALLAAKAGAAFISPFAGRLDDIGGVGMELISDIIEIYSNYDFKTEVLVASVRGPLHVLQAAMMGADVATVPTSVIKALYNHPLTDKGLEAFIADWEKTGQSILGK